MCKEMPVIPVNKVVDKIRKIRKMRTEEEERHKGSLTPEKSRGSRGPFLTSPLGANFDPGMNLSPGGEFCPLG
jgi:hypothetical protein